MSTVPSLHQNHLFDISEDADEEREDNDRSVPHVNVALLEKRVAEIERRTQLLLLLMLAFVRQGALRA